VLPLLLASAFAQDPVSVPPGEIRFTRYVKPEWPAEVSGGEKARSCQASVAFDEGGVPLKVEVSGCSEDFQASATEALQAWRIHPVERDGLPIAVQFEVSLTFKPAPPESRMHSGKHHRPSDHPDVPEPETRQWWRLGSVPEESAAASELAFEWTLLVEFPQLPPRTPRLARKHMLEGDCFVRMYLDQSGRPYGVVVEDCPDVFVEPTLEAARRWRIQPVQVEGKAYNSTVVLEVEYRL
jgi:hypothetical protein